MFFVISLEFYQLSHNSKAYRTFLSDIQRTYYLLAEGDAAGAVDGADVGCELAGDACCAGAGVGVAAGALSEVPCKTDRPPFSAGNANIKATSIKAAAAPIVILANKLAVPRGPKAVDDKLLENNAPASAFPG